ncbi:hypothetical protein [Citrobacter portucalensis]|uniref:hypothetical protein n=1 Tax=Citrobacter portucalensis TaxID=1639133 RepID=UPI003F1A2CCB
MKHRSVIIDNILDIIPMLAGKVFHATPTTNMKLIQEFGGLVPGSELLYCDYIWNSAWSEEKAWTEMIVPYIEVGYKGKVSLNHIYEEWDVSLSM